MPSRKPLGTRSQPIVVHRDEEDERVRTTTKRDWLQIALNVAIAAGGLFAAYDAIRHPRSALMILLAIIGTGAFFGAVGLALQLVGRLTTNVWRSEKADRIRLRLLGKVWLAVRFPSLWEWLREDVRQHKCCEMSDCWNEPMYEWEEHKLCSEHYAQVVEIAATDRVRP